jgi:integrase
LLSPDPFLEVRIASKEVVRGFLTLDEIKRIEQLENLSDALQQVRDIFLFACYTGMAYIDVKQFNRQNVIKEVDGSICIHKPRQKTGQLSIIPLLPPAIRILERYAITGIFLILGGT